MSEQPVVVGDTLHGFCNGFFGRDSYSDKVVIAMGVDWVVARPETDPDARIAEAQFASFWDRVEQMQDLLQRWRSDPTI